MSIASKLALPIKLSYGFAQASKLIEEVIDLCMRHDLVYMLQNEADSNWKAVQQQKYEALLVANNTNSKLISNLITLTSYSLMKTFALSSWKSQTL